MANLPASFDDSVPSRTARRTVIALLLLLLFVPVVRFFAMQGMVWPVRIAGGSMAGPLYGPHLSVVCDDCGITFCCGAEYVPESRTAVCPNCGFTENRLDVTATRAGKRVVIDRWSRWMHAAEQWQSVAFVSPQDPDRLAVKRLVASGGQIEIRDGDVFVDGKIQRKTLQQLRDLQILVHDDRFRPQPTAGLPDRWRSKHSGSLWRATPNGYLCDARAATQGTQGDTLRRYPDWLEYTQWTCWPNPAPPAPRTQAAGVLDHYGYNQNFSRSQLSRVGDIMLRCEIKVDGKGVVVLRTDSGVDRFQLELTYPTTACRLYHNGALVWQAEGTSLGLKWRQPWVVELAVCDQRVLVAINAGGLLEYRFQPSVGPRPIVAPLAVWTSGLRVQFDAPRIYRDVYYLGPAGERRWVAPHSLGPGQWFVVGDNVPVSIDSRRIGPVADDVMLGPVYRFGD